MLYNYILIAIDQPHLKDTNAVNNVAELLMKGGFIMIPILLLSIFSIYLFIERFLYTRKNAAINPDLIYNVISELRNNRLEEALAHTRNDITSIGRILENGLNQPGKTPKDCENYMEATANLEISEMEKNTGYLGIIAGIAPMLGFIGTIYQKMICSGTGLIVGVIAYSCYHYLQMMIDRYSIDMQRQVNEVVKAL